MVEYTKDTDDTKLAEEMKNSNKNNNGEDNKVEGIRNAAFDDKHQIEVSIIEG